MIFLSDDDEDIYADDDEHAIPRLKVIDAVVGLRSGSRYLGISIKKPLNNDSRSRQRLLRKIENYISDIVVNRTRMESEDKGKIKDMRIYVSINSKSAPGIFSLLDHCKPWVEDNNIAFLVDINADTELR